MMKVFRRAVVAIAVVGGAAVLDARAIDAETVEDVDLVSSGYVKAWVPAIPAVAKFELTIGDRTFTPKDVDAAAGGTLTLSFQNHTVGSPPEVERILCPGAESGKRAGLRLRVTGLSTGTEVAATFSAASGTGVSSVIKLGPFSLEATASDVRAGVCEKL